MWGLCVWVRGLGVGSLGQFSDAIHLHLLPWHVHPPPLRLFFFFFVQPSHPPTSPTTNDHTKQQRSTRTAAILEHVPKLGGVGGIAAQSTRQADNGQGNVGRGRHGKNEWTKSCLVCVVELSVDGTIELLLTCFALPKGTTRRLTCCRLDEAMPRDASLPTLDFIRLEADHEAISTLCAPSRLPPWPARLRCIYDTTPASTIQSTNPIIAPARNFATSPRFEARSRRLDVPIHVQPRSPRCGCCRVLVQTRPSIHCSADRRIRALTRWGGVCSAAWRMCTGISLFLSHALGVHNTLACGFEGWDGYRPTPGHFLPTDNSAVCPRRYKTVPYWQQDDANVFLRL